MMKNTTLTVDCGFTVEEIKKYFSSYILAMATKNNKTTEAIVDDLAKFYDGYCFGGPEKIFNPYSFAKTFRKQEFLNHWSSLIYKLGERNAVSEALEKVAMNRLIVDIYNIKSIDLDSIASMKIAPTTMLLQSGYLTLGNKFVPIDMGTPYSIVVPNKEIKEALGNLYFKVKLNMQDLQIESIHTTLRSSVK